VVLDGELVVWADGRLDFGALQARLVAGRRLGELVAELPASYVAFDVLAVGDVDLMPLPWTDRRARLEQLMAPARPPLQLCPATTDRDQALEWFTTWAPLGIEGLLAKGMASAYMPGTRGWVKVRHRHSAEAIVGAVVGPLTEPQRLVLGAYNSAGELRVVGSTSQLRPADRRAVGAHLLAPAAGHPWPVTLPSSVLAGLPGQRPATAVTLAAPAVVVEVLADTAFEGRWRHLTRYVRIRADLDPADVTIAGLIL
jgi:ATP-dependent DNA ligase